MIATEQYVDLRGRNYALSGLDQEELAAIARLKEFAKNAEWSAYRNFWMAEVDKLYTPRGMARRDILETVVYRVGQDIGSRIGIAHGKIRPPDNENAVPPASS